MKIDLGQVHPFANQVAWEAILEETEKSGNRAPDRGLLLSGNV